MAKNLFGQSKGGASTKPIPPQPKGNEPISKKKTGTV